MARIRDDDTTAVDALVERFQHELVGFFYNLCYDQLIAEELAQDVFVNVYRARARWQPTARVRTWMYRIAHNRWIDHCRRRHDGISLDAERDDGGFRLGDAMAAPDAGPADDPQRAATIRTRVQSALDLLPAGQREVFILANNQGLKYNEISGILGIPEGTVKSRMHHAIRTLRDELADLVEP
jgi:RNA polymerase sigma-70 factor (ECF subfamily)